MRSPLLLVTCGFQHLQYCTYNQIKEKQITVYIEIIKVSFVSELEAGEDFEFKKIDIRTNSEGSLEMNQDDSHPSGKASFLLVDRDFVITESGAICLYIAELYGKLIPENKEAYYK